MKKKVIIVMVLVLGVLLGTSYLSYSYFKVQKWDELIYPGVMIEDVDLSGKSMGEALKIIKEKYSNKILDKEIVINADGKEYKIGYEQLRARYNISNVVKEAFEYGKDLKTFDKKKLIDSEDKHQLSLEFEYNDSVVSSVIETIKKDINKEAINAKISMPTRGNFLVTDEVLGKKIKEEELKKEILEAVNGDVNVDSIKINAPIEEVEPKVKAESLRNINAKIAGAETQYRNSDSGRATNIELGAKTINGLLMMPGDVFSFNELVGDTTADKGYKDAGIIVNNQLTKGLGGGICQVSTTLYQAVLKTGLYSVQRTNHSLLVGYAEPGQDATISYDYLDYKFKNTFEYPIYIEGYSYNNELYFNIYSNESLKNRSYKITSEITETLKPKVTQVKDPKLYVGESKVVLQDFTGYKVTVYREIYENGKFVEKEVISKDTYPAVDGEVNIGTKPREDKEEKKEEKNEEKKEEKNEDENDKNEDAENTQTTEINNDSNTAGNSDASENNSNENSNDDTEEEIIIED